MTDSITPSLNRINKTESEELTTEAHQQQDPSNEQEPNRKPPSERKGPLPTGFPDDFPHHSLNTDRINLTPQYATPSTSSKLLYHGTTIRKTHSSSPQSTTPPPAHNDTESRKCWICYDGDEDDDPISPKSLDRQSDQDAKRWVKACRCSLIAHESCLLTWITTYQLTHPTPPPISSPLLTPVKCPQCSSTYQISQPPSPVLSLIHRLRRPYHTAISWCALGSVILGIGVGASSYGLWASRCFLGPARWNRWISNPQHPRGLNFLKFFQLSLVGPILILSRTKQLDSVLPFLPISLIFSTLPPLSLDGDFDRSSDFPSPLTLEHIFPPEPGLTLCLIPWMRIGWNLLWTRISEFVLDREYAGISYPYPLGVGPGAPRPAIAEANPNDPADPMVANNNNQPGDEEEQNERPPAEVVLDYANFRTILRVSMEALIWPGAASVVGTLLLLLSKNRAWLQTLLGLKPSFNSSLINRTAYSSDQHQFSTGSKFFHWIKSSIYQLIHKVTKLESFSSLASVDHVPRRARTTMNPFNLMGPYYLNVDEDPIWWRNTLGGSLLVIIKDLLSLVEKVLRLRKLKCRRILGIVPIEPSHTRTNLNATTTTPDGGDI